MGTPRNLWKYIEIILGKSGYLYSGILVRAALVSGCLSISQKANLKTQGDAENFEQKLLPFSKRGKT